MFGLFSKKSVDMARVKAEAAEIVSRRDQTYRPRKDSQTAWNELVQAFEKRPLTEKERELIALEAVKEWVRAAQHSGAEELNLNFSTYELLDLPRSVGGLTNLRKLILASTGVRRLTHLSGLTRLEVLDLSYCRNLTDISPLMGMTGLVELDLSRSKVTNLRALSTLTGLRSLKLEKCNISDLSPLAGLTQLEHLDLSNTKVTDISPLAGLTRLKSLGLWNTGVKDFSPLAALTGLEMLDLWNTRISDLTPLSGMSGLKFLDLSHTDATDLTPVETLSDLKALRLWNTPLQAQMRWTGGYAGRWYDGDIHAAASSGDLQAVKDRVAQGAMIADDQWSGPIHAAVQGGHLDICRFFVSLDPEMANDMASYDGCEPTDTPLSIAIKSRQQAIIDFLWDNGARAIADPEDWEYSWLTGLHLGSAARVNDLATLRRLLDAGARHDARDEYELTALHWAVAQKNEEASCLLLNLWRADQGKPAVTQARMTQDMLTEALEQLGDPKDAFRFASRR